MIVVAFLFDVCVIPLKVHVAHQMSLRPHIPGLTYLVGLSGGIASGKSNACRVLEGLGAVCVDSDKVAHKGLNFDVCVSRCATPATCSV